MKESTFDVCMVFLGAIESAVRACMSLVVYVLFFSFVWLWISHGASIQGLYDAHFKYVSSATGQGLEGDNVKDKREELRHERR